MSDSLEVVESQIETAGKRRILATAGLISVGQLLGSVLGFVRSEVLNVLFFGTPSGAFVIAMRPIQQVSSLIVSGDTVSGALIPTFVDYAGEAHREELRRIYSTLANLVLIPLAVAFVLIEIFAPAFVPLLAPPQDFGGPAGVDLTISLVRIIAFSFFGLGLFAVASGLLYAMREVVFPAFAGGIYHICIIVGGIIALALAASAFGVSWSSLTHPGVTAPAVVQAHLASAHGLAIGAAVGTLAQFLLLVPGLRKVRIHWRLVLDLRHPAVRQILRLYVPLLAGLAVSIAQQVLDTGLWARSPGGAPQNSTALATGTTLTQFPVGLVAAALSFAVLPLLAGAASRADLPDFKRTLRTGIRLGLLLMVPAAVGLWVLRFPIVELLFQHGTCGPDCTVRNALAVQNYAYELPFIAVDQLLIAAFYARKNTLVPNVVGVVSILFYLVIALPFGLTIGLPALAFSDTAKNTSHALILLVLLTLAIGNLGWRDLLGGTARIVAAALVMAAVCWAGVTLLPAHVSAFSLDHTSGQALTLLVAGGGGALLYFALTRIFGVEEVALVGGIVRRRLLGKR
ncbi:MAG TPA: lipid II flippase MurJ [Ktedonobacterales bacterium]